LVKDKKENGGKPPINKDPDQGDENLMFDFWLYKPEIKE